MVYLNNAATSYPKPQQVLAAAAACLAAPPSPQARSAGADLAADPAAHCRQSLARLFGLRDPERIFFTSGATESFNLLVRGLEFESGTIVVTATEHNAVLRPLVNILAPQLRQRSLRLEFLPCSTSGWVDPGTLARSLGPDTRAVFLNHCSNVTGTVQDLAAAAALTRARGVPLIVDASQSAGCLPLDAGALGLDALVFTGHKSLMGMEGSGGFYASERLPLHQVKFGGTGRRSAQLRTAALIDGIEAGTMNLPGIAALGAGADWVLEQGVGRIAAAEADLIARLRLGLARLPGVRLFGAENQPGGPVLSFVLDPLFPEEVGALLADQYEIRVRTGLHCCPLMHRFIGSAPRGTVRVSVSPFTTVEEIDTLLAAVGELAAGLQRGKIP